jgi:hypothetical protein
MADYSRAWEKYKRRWARNRILGWSFLPPVLLLAFASRFVHNPRTLEAIQVASVVLFVCWLVVRISSQYQKDHFLCPRCGKQFHRGGPTYFGASNSNLCWHCGLPEYAKDDGPAGWVQS